MMPLKIWIVGARKKKIYRLIGANPNKAYNGPPQTNITPLIYIKWGHPKWGSIGTKFISSLDLYNPCERIFLVSQLALSVGNVCKRSTKRRTNMFLKRRDDLAKLRAWIICEELIALFCCELIASQGLFLYGSERPLLCSRA